jgi:hypothetical protein
MSFGETRHPCSGLDDLVLSHSLFGWDCRTVLLISSLADFDCYPIEEVVVPHRRPS